jgi:hypothetical protein
LDEFYDSAGAGGFVREGFEVVVVVEELGVGVGGVGEFEGEGEEGFAEGVVEDCGAVGAVFVEGLK